MAMGSAFTGLADDASAPYFNPNRSSTQTLQFSLGFPTNSCRQATKRTRHPLNPDLLKAKPLRPALEAQREEQRRKRRDPGESPGKSSSNNSTVIPKASD